MNSLAMETCVWGESVAVAVQLCGPVHCCAADSSSAAACYAVAVARRCWVGVLHMYPHANRW
jgi:hypothetical protein